ncbi:MAG: PEP-CTERM sorting domain-containing protein [Verrucomicrobiales bacterium]|nr:PEP-CTERM sorting domain-containing protein [Verrucomicrobiales bacterium]
MDSSNGWTTFTVASGGTMTIGGAAQKGATFSGAQTWQKQGAGVLHVTGVMQDLGNIRFDSGGGAVTISGTVLGTGAASIMSNNSAAQSTVNLTGNGKFAIGGQLAINNNNMHLDWNMDGNSELSATNLYLGWNSASNEVLNFNQSGGTVTLNGAGTGFLNVMNNNTNATTTAAYNLNGGVLGLKQAIVGTGGALKLNGGTVKLLEGGVELFKKGTVGGKVIVSAGGAIIDTNGLVAVADAVNALPLEHDVTLSGKDGGLKVIGGGALLLSKVNTYDGGTVIENAILSVGADATLGSGDVVVGNNSTLYLFNNAAIDSGATLSFGSGVDITLGYNGTLTLAGLYDQTANHWFDEGEYLSANLSAYGFSGLGSLTVIPEPSTWLLMITGAGLLTVTRRRRG